MMINILQTQFTHRPTYVRPRFGDNKTRTYQELFDPRNSDTYAAEACGPCADYHYPDAYIQSMVKKYVAPGEAFLELGVNRGNNLLPLVLEGREGYGVDLSQSALDALKWDAGTLKQQNPSKPLQYHVQQYDFAETGDLPPEWGNMEGKFKAIYAAFVMSHLSDAHFIKTMQSLQKYLTPGGVIITDIIDPYNPAKSILNRLAHAIPNPLEKSSIITNADPEGTLSPEQLLREGFGSHSQKAVDEAFFGLTKIEIGHERFTELRDVRPVGNWDLPFYRQRWVVYQKPYNA